MARTKVQSELIATNAISGTIIADNAITATHIATNAISGTLVQSSGIVTDMIASNNVTAAKIVTNAIHTRHIADDQVTEDKLANAINTSIAAKLPLAGGTLTGALTTNGVINTGTSHNFAINTPNSLRINIDSNNSATDQVFVIGHNQTAVDNTNSALMTILESGDVGIGVTSPTETFVVSGDTNTTGQMYLGPEGGSRRPFAKASNWGYSSGYKAIVLGSASATYHTSISGAVTLSFNYDPSGNSNGSFSGNGNEILFRNGTQFVTPNSADDAFNLMNLCLKDGDVGIGTATPARMLHVKSSDANIASFEGHQGEGLVIVSNTDGRVDIIGYDDGASSYNNLVIRATGSYDQLLFDSSGHIGIPPGRRFYLDNTSIASGDTYIDEYSANEVGITTGGSRKLAVSGGNLYVSGSVNANHNFSDERLKENIVVIPNAVDKVKTLRGITFTRKDNGNVGTGLIAQELEKVLPEAVYKSKKVDTLDNPDAEEWKAINYGNTVGLLVEAIKELEARIKELEG